MAVRLAEHHFTGKVWPLFGDYQGTWLTEGIDVREHFGSLIRPTEWGFQREPVIGNGRRRQLGGGTGARSLLGVSVTAGEPYSAVFPDGKIPQSAYRLRQNICWPLCCSPTSESWHSSRLGKSETLTDNKGAMPCADWIRGMGRLTMYQFLDEIRSTILIRRERRVSCWASTPLRTDAHSWHASPTQLRLARRLH